MVFVAETWSWNKILHYSSPQREAPNLHVSAVRRRPFPVPTLKKEKFYAKIARCVAWKNFCNETWSLASKAFWIPFGHQIINYTFVIIKSELPRREEPAMGGQRSRSFRHLAATWSSLRCDVRLRFIRVVQQWARQLEPHRAVGLINELLIRAKSYRMITMKRFWSIEIIFCRHRIKAGEELKAQQNRARASADHSCWRTESKLLENLGVLSQSHLRLKEPENALPKWKSYRANSWGYAKYPSRWPACLSPVHLHFYFEAAPPKVFLPLWSRAHPLQSCRDPMRLTVWHASNEFWQNNHLLFINYLQHQSRQSQPIQRAFH